MKTSIINAIGNTPLISLELDKESKASVYAKLEMQNPFGMKDRVAKTIIFNAIDNGQLKKGDPIIESSSGTLAMGIALVGKYLGFDVHIVTDPRIDELTFVKLKSLDVHIHIIDKMAAAGGWQQARLEYLYQFLATHPNAFWPQQYENPNNPLSYRLLAEELLNEIEQVDYLVGGVGSGGSLCGTAHALKEQNPDLRVIAVDAIGSAIFNQKDNPHRLQSGLGNSIHPKNVDYTIIDEAHWLNDEEAFTWTRELARHEQIFAGNSSGSVYAVSRWLSKNVDRGKNIICIFPDRGDRYLNTIYNDDYCKANSICIHNLNSSPINNNKKENLSTWFFSRINKGEYSIDEKISLY
ncbi:PLP-dependent cysteine synthase family protein [Rummeliibacillus suwonensis]|uniref:PLP-dependent cysteine synthase family protein n=1 Tax=Rummeliibacillus suwonensis TaxID=1306154 RepID=UPI001AB00C86|nr:cysteine synthase family protein [Rummeliibacillus suwonensis]MBO2535977.1 cysteine synthase family protein [Rummeliibacillus suwonensis]